MKMTEEQRKAMRITVDYTNMTDKYLGDKGYWQSGYYRIYRGRITKRCYL